MAHYRQQIREAVATLVTGLTTTTTNVHQTRVYPLATLPALSVYTDSEEVDEDASTMGTHNVIRINVRIEIRSSKTSDMDDQMDTILGEIQAAINADRTLSGLAYETWYIGLNDIEYSGEGDMEHGLAVAQYIVGTGFNDSDPETIVL